MLCSDKLQSVGPHTRVLLNLHLNTSHIRLYDYILGNTVKLNSTKCTVAALAAMKLVIFKTLEFIVYALSFNCSRNIATILLQSPIGLDS